MSYTDDPFAAAELREALERRAKRDREWRASAFADLHSPASRRREPEQSTADYARDTDARIKAEIAAQNERDLAAAKAAAEIALTLPPPKPFTS